MSEGVTTSPASEKEYGKGGHVRSFDGLRALAITMVLGFHFKFPGMTGGARGVTVFFALSGFLITGILTRSGNVLTGRRLGRFYLRRFLRLFPALFVVCAFCALYAVTTLSGPARQQLLRECLAAVTYTMNFYIGRGHSTHFGYLTQTWSLGVEEWFYIFWPLVLVGLFYVCRGKSRQLSLSVLGLALCVALWRAHLTMQHLNAHVGLNIDGQMDCLLYGCAAALSFAELRVLIGRHDRTMSFVALVALAYILADCCTNFGSSIPYNADYAITSIASTLVILRLVCASNEPINQLFHRVFEWRLALWIGTISYGIYLWHPVMIHVFERIVGFQTFRDKAIVGVLALSATLVVAQTSYHFIEMPFLRLKDRFEERTPTTRS